MTTDQPKKKRTRISQLRIDEISLVSAGANPHARVLIAKRAEPVETEPRVDSTDSMQTLLAAIQTKLEHVNKKADAITVAAQTITREQKMTWNDDEAAPYRARFDAISKVEPRYVSDSDEPNVSRQV